MRGAVVIDTILTCGVEGTVVGFCLTWRANELNVDEAGRRWVGDNEGVTIDDLLVGLTATTVVVADVFRTYPYPAAPGTVTVTPVAAAMAVAGAARLEVMVPRIPRGMNCVG